MNKLHLWKHQQEVFDKVRDENYLLSLQIGVGKTAIAVKLIEWILYKNPTTPVLILAPKSVCESWFREFDRFSDLQQFAQVITSATKDKKIKMLKNYEKFIHIMNYDAVASLIPYMPQYQTIILDESHFIKNPKAIRTKAILKLAENANHKYLLTGTPVVKNLMDIFSQFKFLDGGESLGKNFFEFRAKYFHDKNAYRRGQGNYFPDWVIKPESEKQLLTIMQSKSVSLKKIDCLSLPPQVYTTLFADMGSQQKTAYKEMAKELITYINGNAATASIALTKALRLQQIASGFLRDEDGVEHRFEDVPRLQVLLEELETLTIDHKIIVWSNFVNNLDLIYGHCESLGYQPVKLYGGADAQIAIDEFQGNEKCRVLIANPASGGTGITLTASSVSIYYSNSFNFAHRAQSEGRNHRIGSERHESITYIDILCKGSIEEQVYAVLRERKDFSDVVLNLNTQTLGL